MDKENKRLTDKQILEQVCNTVDEISEVIKTSSRSVFDSLVSRTIETFSDIFDEYKDKTKRKIIEKGSVNAENNNIQK